MGANISAVGDGFSRQRALKNAISCTGTGLHSGARVSIVLHPAPSDTGVRFRRADVGDECPEIVADYRHVVDTCLGTTLGNDAGVTVATVEHLMAALSGCGIDNVLVEVDGPEVPIMDGSAWPFVFLVECAGTIEQNARRSAIEILKPVAVEEDGCHASLAPGGGFSLDFEIDFDSPFIGHQNMFVRMVNGTFQSEISRARTFGFLEEVEKLHKMGFARGGSLENAVVLNGDRIMNEEGLRYEDEFVRHKILDSIGDLYLAGRPIIGHFHGVRSGHALNHSLLEALFADETAWCLATLPADYAGELDTPAAAVASA
ncbi:MAG: UDP-3-O-acyl-N-acetylglucosamine deacetylase [Alphaproteobacteria bacterium]